MRPPLGLRLQNGSSCPVWLADKRSTCCNDLLGVLATCTSVLHRREIKQSQEMIQLWLLINCIVRDRSTNCSLLYVYPVVSNSIKKKGPLFLNGREAIKLTERDNNGASDTVGHNNSEDTHHPGISCPKLELIGLVLQRHKDTLFRQTTSTQTKRFNSSLR